MPQYSNRTDLPEPFLLALMSDDYSTSLDAHFKDLPEKYRGCQFSVTSLVRSPRQRILYLRHHHKLLLDPMSNFYRMKGHIVHSILEQFADPARYIREERLGRAFTYQSAPGLLKGIKRKGKPVDTVYFHGQVDLLDKQEDHLIDWKTTSAYSMMHEHRDEYIAQLNMLAYLWKAEGRKVTKISNFFIFLDWKEKEAREKAESGYPQEQVAWREAPLWPQEQTEAYIRERLRLHMESDMMEDDALPECTDKERWAKEPAYKVYRINPKTNEISSRAAIGSGQFTSKKDAEAWAFHPDHAYDPKGKSIDYHIKFLPASSPFCALCEIRSWCDQWREKIQPFEKQEEES